jgi:hypothetical protein
MFFTKQSYTSLCIEEMHMALHLFQLFKKDWQEALKGSHKTKPLTKVSKQAISNRQGPTAPRRRDSTLPTRKMQIAPPQSPSRQHKLQNYAHIGENDAVRCQHPIQMIQIYGFARVAHTRRQESIATKKLLDDPSIEEMMLNATIN